MKYVIGNHKMNLSKKELIPYLKQLDKLSKNTENQIGISLPYIYLPLANKLLKRSNVMFGAQNMAEEVYGAYTGEISVNMLKDYNTDFVVLGHSERRHIYKETNKSINKKLILALKNDIIPILCVGETLEERDRNLTDKVLKTQLKEALKDIEIYELKRIFIAYEPVWAIGTGKSATKDEAKKAIKFIKEEINKLYNATKDIGMVVLYGGSLNQNNYKDIFDIDEIDGGLIGGASLKIETFNPLINY